MKPSLEGVPFHSLDHAAIVAAWKPPDKSRNTAWTTGGIGHSNASIDSSSAYAISGLGLALFGGRAIGQCITGFSALSRGGGRLLESALVEDISLPQRRCIKSDSRNPAASA